jgi:geranyl-CoA carboxylase alpha subunit
MLAKVIAHGSSRDRAREQLAAALDETVALGVPTNKQFLAAVLRDAEFAAGGASTDFIARRFAAIRRSPAPPEAFALAAVLAVELCARVAGYGEWTSWSNDPARVTRARLASDDTVADLALRLVAGCYEVRTHGAEYRLRLLALDGPRARFSLERPDRAHEASMAFVLADDGLHLAWGGASWCFADRLHEPPRKREQSLSGGRLVAPMNGRVAAVHARAGDRIQAEAPLVVLEAMKMEHALTLPAAITVKAVHVAAGVQVAPGQLLVEFETG